MKTITTHSDRLPTIGGRVHGIVGWDPLAVQCDACLRVWNNEGEPMITTLREVTFNNREPGPRLCADCWEWYGPVTQHPDSWPPCDTTFRNQIEGDNK